MSQHLLHSPQISPVFQKMGGKGMTQGMWGDILVQISFLRIAAQDFEKALPAHTTAAGIEKQYFLGHLLYQRGRPCCR